MLSFGFTHATTTTDAVVDPLLVSSASLSLVAVTLLNAKTAGESLEQCFENMESVFAPASRTQSRSPSQGVGNPTRPLATTSPEKHKGPAIVHTHAGRTSADIEAPLPPPNSSKVFVRNTAPSPPSMTTRWENLSGQ